MIPRVFHFIYGLRDQNQPFPLAYYLALESCRRVNRPDRICFHYRNEPFGPYWEEIKPHLELRPVGPPLQWLQDFEYKDSWVRPYAYAHEADFIRVDILNREGGVYADIDTLFVNPVPEPLFNREFVMGEECGVWSDRLQRTVPSLCNALMMARAGSRFGQTWFERMGQEFDGTWSRHSCELPRQLAQEYPDSIHVEPSGSFFPYLWDMTGIRDLFERPRPEAGRRAYSIHLWNHLWWRRTRNDWIWLSGGDIDHDYVASGISSYSQLAARFLPDRALDRAGAGWRKTWAWVWPQ